MALNIYIYGSPKGFQTTVKDNPSLMTYFEQLYITSRRGRRLMVNRNKNGETSYNYLVYDIIGNRPNAFFGMSFILTNNQYVDDFAAIYSIFDNEFEEIIKRHRLIRRTEDNTLQYCALAFDSVSDEIEYIQNSILKALKDSGIAFCQYDNTFANTNTSKIVLYNNTTPKAIIQGAFKKVSWIAISPNFVVKEKDDEDDALEVSLYDVDQKHTIYLRKLTDIAINNRDKSSLPELNEIIAFVKDTRNDIMKFAISLQNKSQSNAQEYFDKAKLLSTLADQANTLREQISNDDQSDDKSDSTDKDNVPEPKITTRKCHKCGKTYDVSEFPKDSEFCVHCHHNPTPSIVDNIVEFILNSPQILAAVVILIVVGAGTILLNKIDPTPQEREIVQNKTTVTDSIATQGPGEQATKAAEAAEQFSNKLFQIEQKNEITEALNDKWYDTALNKMNEYFLYDEFKEELITGCTNLINSKITITELENFKKSYQDCMKIPEVADAYAQRKDALTQTQTETSPEFPVPDGAIAAIYETDSKYKHSKNSPKEIQDTDSTISLQIKKFYRISSTKPLTVYEDKYKIINFKPTSDNKTMEIYSQIVINDKTQIKIGDKTFKITITK